MCTCAVLWGFDSVSPVTLTMQSYSCYMDTSLCDRVWVNVSGFEVLVTPASCERFFTAIKATLVV